MKSGKLRKLIDILRPVEGLDELGTVVNKYGVISTSRASISPISGNESFINSAIVNDATHYIITRKTDITPKDIIGFECSYYDVTQVLNKMKLGVELMILAKKRFNSAPLNKYWACDATYSCSKVFCC